MSDIPNLEELYRKNRPRQANRPISEPRRTSQRTPEPARRPRSKAPVFWTLAMILVISFVWLSNKDKNTPVASSNELRTARNTATSPIKLQSAVVCLDVVEREPKYTGTSFNSDVEEVFCWSNVSNGNNRYIDHTYYYEGNWAHSERLYIRANSRWRTWSKKKVRPGNWSVKITDDVGNQLGLLSFSVSNGYSKPKSNSRRAPIVRSGSKMRFLGTPDRILVFKESNVNSNAVGSLGKNDVFWLLTKSFDKEWAKISLENNTEGWIKLFTYKDHKNPRFPIRIVATQ